MEKELMYPWPFPDVRNPPRSFVWRNKIACGVVGTISKLFMNYCTKLNLYNVEHLHKVVESRPTGTPLLTACNHYSCMDDPTLWGILKLKHIWNSQLMRWSPAAHDIVFTTRFYNWGSSSGKVIPIIRGKGVYQRAMNFMVERLNDGQWVHIFPEGKVNMAFENLRLKWGIGRLVYESKVNPIILLFYHVGMEDVLPCVTPYIPRLNKKVTLVIGEPLDLGDVVNNLKSKNEDPVVARKIITDIIQEELLKIRVKAEQLHYQ